MLHEKHTLRKKNVIIVGGPPLSRAVNGQCRGFYDARTCVRTFLIQPLAVPANKNCMNSRQHRQISGRGRSQTQKNARTCGTHAGADMDTWPRWIGDVRCVRVALWWRTRKEGSVGLPSRTLLILTRLLISFQS